MKVQRREYLDWLKNWREKQLIKVVTGVRRCGKSTLFELYIDYLKKTGVEENQIIFINLEDVENENLLDYKSLYNYIISRLRKDNKYTYVFIDEVQQCKNFEKAVDSLFLKKYADVYITGSNAYMLSGELATLLSGRYVEIQMLPLSFSEYYEFTNPEKNNIKTAFNNYLKYGSFPYVASLIQDNINIKGYIDGIYNTIIVKEVAIREGITDIAVLENKVKFLCSSIGSPI